MTAEAQPRLSIDSTTGECYIGVQRIENIPLHAINILPQSRPDGTYSEEGKQELVDSMSVPGSDDINLITPLLVAAFSTQEEAEAYALQVCAIFDKPFTTELQPAPDGAYYILIAGHNRVDAIYRKIQQSTRLTNIYTKQGVYIGCSVLESPTPLEALSQQLAENKHERPPLSSDAIAIHGLHKHLIEHGMTDAQARKELKARLGISPDRINKSLLYMFMPEEIRKLAADKYKISSRKTSITQSDILALCSGELIEMYAILAIKEGSTTGVYDDYDIDAMKNVLRIDGSINDPVVRENVGQRLQALAYGLIEQKIRAEQRLEFVDMQRFVESAKTEAYHDIQHPNDLIYEFSPEAHATTPEMVAVARARVIKTALATSTHLTNLANRLQAIESAA